MPEETPAFLVPVTRLVPTSETIPIEFWQLALERGDADNPGRLVILLRPLDADGRWSNDVEPVKVELVDDPGGALVPDSPLAQQLGIVGQPVRTAIRVVLQLVAGIGGA